MYAAPFIPGQTMSTIFVVTSDDASLHFDPDNLTERQKRDEAESQSMVGFLQMAQMGLGTPANHIMLYEQFGEAPWPEVLERYAAFFTRMGATPIPAEHCHLHPVKGYYDSIAAALPDTDSITLYMTTGANSVLHKDPQAYAISQNVNSKFHFAENAPGFGIPVPDTLVTTKGQLYGPDVAVFMARHENDIMVKTLGMGGSRNVIRAGSLAEVVDYVTEFNDDWQVLLQQRLDPDDFTEMTADLTIRDNDVSISNVRKILFSDGVWVGNYISPNVEVPAAHEQHLLRVGDYVRRQGYSAPEGLICGVDYFIRNDTADFIATEINCRWTGGLFATEMLRQIGATQESCIAFIDLVIGDKFEDYLHFIDQHLWDKERQDAPFHIIPLGVSPARQMIDGKEHFYTWQMIAGDFEAFKHTRRDELGDGVLMLAEAIDISGLAV